MQKNYKIGLKLWSINTDYYYKEAQKLYQQGEFNYIELYVVPNTLTTVNIWKKLNIPFILHAPHFMHKINLADKDKRDYNKKIYAQVEIFREELNAQYTIVHSGMNGTIEETIHQLHSIKPKNFIIENKPAHPPYFESLTCRGHSIEEIKQVLTQTNCHFCLDIGHAICTANFYNYPPYTFLEKFNQLSPIGYHISDGDITSPHDQHLNIGHGNYNFSRIFSNLNLHAFISVETNKSSKHNLEDFKQDITILQEYIK